MGIPSFSPLVEGCTRHPALPQPSLTPGGSSSGKAAIAPATLGCPWNPRIPSTRHTPPHQQAATVRHLLDTGNSIMSPLQPGGSERGQKSGVSAGKILGQPRGDVPLTTPPFLSSFLRCFGFFCNHCFYFWKDQAFWGPTTRPVVTFLGVLTSPGRWPSSLPWSRGGAASPACQEPEAVNHLISGSSLRPPGN